MFLLQFLLAALLLLTIPIADATAARKRVALVIGNSAYSAAQKLTNTRHDAVDMAAALRRLGFVVHEGLDLDKRSMERIIRDFDRDLPGSDLAVLFYAGHAIQANGQNHFLPIDARLKTAGDIDFESLPLDLVLKRMEHKAKVSIVLLDACRDNPLARNLSETLGTRGLSVPGGSSSGSRAGSAVSQGLAEIKAGIGSLISFSTQPGNVASDGSGRNSPYTAALLGQIETPGRDILSLLARVRGDVVQSTQGRQVPWEHTSLLGPVHLGEMTSQPAPTAATKPTIINSRPAGPTAAEAWPLVEDSRDVAVLEAYIKRYSDTFYADVARLRIEEIAKEAAPAAQPATPPYATTTAAAPTAPAPPLTGGSPPSDGITCRGRTAWMHNGSRMVLVAEGTRRTFAYLQPREGLARIGVAPGTVLFIGERSGNRYFGVARRFSERCGYRAYSVGGEARDERTVVMGGTAPSINARTCAPTGSFADRLEFTFDGCLD